MIREIFVRPESLATTTLLAILGIACQRQPASTVAVESEPTTRSEASIQDSRSSSCAPLEQLAALDPRTPVPLQPMMAWHQKQNMLEHLVAIQRITGAVAREDWAEVASASKLIESSPRMQRMCRHMGAGADGFTELALAFHRRADRIGVAARAEDGPAVLRATAHTLEACTGCHATYRQDVVDAATWQARTGSGHAPAMTHEGH